MTDTDTPSPATGAGPVYWRIILLGPGGHFLQNQQFLLRDRSAARLDGIAKRLVADCSGAVEYLHKEVPTELIPEAIVLRDGQDLPLGVELSWIDDDLGKVDWSKFG